LITVLRWSAGRQLIWLWLGGLAGTFLLDIDHLIYWFFFQPEKQDSQMAKVLWLKKDFKGLLLLLGRYHDTHLRLIFHTALFQAVLFIFSFYIFTSGGSLFASGLVAGMNLHLLKDEWKEYLEKKYEHQKSWLFWQIKREVSPEELKMYLIIATIIFILLSFFV